LGLVDGLGKRKPDPQVNGSQQAGVAIVEARHVVPLQHGPLIGSSKKQPQRDG
jgi:hypothetical protein